MNEDIKREMRVENVRQWELAAAMGVCEMTLTRKLRRELDEAGRQEMLQHIHAIAAHRAGGDLKCV